MPRLPATRLTLGIAIVLSWTAAAGSAEAAVSLQRVGDFTAPVYVTGAPGDYDRLYVVEQRGTIQVVRGGQVQQFLDLRDVVRSPGPPDNGGGEEGLLSMAFAPDFQQSRLFYVYFTDTNGDNRVEELRAPSADAADATSRRLVLPLPHPTNANHNGGQLQFGPDGMLWLAPGDGGGGNDPAGNAQNLGSPLGKVLRINPRGAVPYAIPPDNPFAAQAGARGEVWSYGLRNPFRFSFDRQTGDLVIADVGQNTTEEIDYAPAASGRGRGLNFGWVPCEGSFVNGSTTQPCAQPGTTLPVIDQTHANGWIAIIGGYVVRDPSLPSLGGRYVYADAGLGQLYSARLALPRALDDRPTGLPVPGVSSFGEDTAGCVYVALLGGAVSRLVENDAHVPCPRPPRGTPGPTTPAGPTPPGRRTVRLRTGINARQRVLRLGGVVVYVRCDVRCTLSADGRLIVGRRSIPMRRLTKRLQAGKRYRITVRLSRAGRRALVSGLRHHRRTKVRVGVRARDGAGHRSALVRRTVRVSR